jgi:DNA processing protein
VVEAGKRSGALITAQYALEQGRELFAVPGSPANDRSLGCNQLIKQGANLLTRAEDVFDAVPRLKGEITATRFRRKPDLTEFEVKVVEALSDGDRQIDQLSRGLSLPVSELMEYLLALELKGVVVELPGKRFALADQ